MCDKCKKGEMIDSGRIENKTYFGVYGDSINFKWIIDLCKNCGHESKMRIKHEN